MSVLLWNFQGYRNKTFQWLGGRRSHRTSHVSNVFQWAAFICYANKGRQPCEKWQLVHVITGDQGDECRKLHTKGGIWNPHQSPPVSMSTKQASLNVLIAKVRSVRPWRSCLHLVSYCWQHFTCDDLVFPPCMATFHRDLSYLGYPPPPFELMLHTSNTTFSSSYLTECSCSCDVKDT